MKEINFIKETELDEFEFKEFKQELKDIYDDLHRLYVYEIYEDDNDFLKNAMN